VTTPTVSDLRVFVPAQHIERSVQFYIALGWTKNWQQHGLVELELAGHRFLLQDYYLKEWAENFMFAITVEDAMAWKIKVEALLGQPGFDGVRVDGPKRERDGALVTHVWDPSGILLHFRQHSVA
jgi:hypothetical protein